MQTNDRNVDRFGRVLRIDKRDRIADADAATLFIVQTKLDRFGSVCDHGKRLRMQVHYMMHSLTGLGVNPREFRKEKPDAIASGLLARLAGYGISFKKIEQGRNAEHAAFAAYTNLGSNLPSCSQRKTHL